MPDKPLISEEELTAFIHNRIWLAALDDDRIAKLTDRQKRDEARALARRMLAAELMYEALKKVQWVDFNDSDYGLQEFCQECRNDKKYGHYDGCQIAAALKAAEGGR